MFTVYSQDFHNSLAFMQFHVISKLSDEFGEKCYVDRTQWLAEQCPTEAGLNAAAAGDYHNVKKSLCMATKLAAVSRR